MDRLIEAMARPAFYPHEVVEPIRVIQTHISYVFLTGEYAYKIKKPVNLEFLDFSTLERRKYFCEEELRLNRLFAPELYLDVRPIYELETGFSLDAGEEATITEYVLRMRQFGNEDLLSNVYERGELTESRVEAIGRLLAAVHGEARSDDSIAAYGSCDAISRMACRTLDILRKYVDVTVPRQDFERLNAFTKEFLESNVDLFEIRRAQGQIRECHGDLHLNNICLYKDKIYFFDRIEFNDLFKNIDVIYDAAFLYMDLHFRDERRLATRFINAYLEATGDYEGVLLLRFYASCRAQVRAKVLSITYDEEEIESAKKPAIQERAAKYIHLARHYTGEHYGRIVLMCGVSGSGKSTVAKTLAGECDAIHVRSDAVRKHLAGVPLEEPGGTIYIPEMDSATYRELNRLGLAIAQAGFFVILDATYHRRGYRRDIISHAQAYGVPVSIVYCTSDDDVLRHRLTERRGDVSDAGVVVMLQQLADFEPFDADESAHVTPVDTTYGVDYSLLEAELLTCV